MFMGSLKNLKCGIATPMKLFQGMIFGGTAEPASKTEIEETKEDYYSAFSSKQIPQYLLSLTPSKQDCSLPVGQPV